MQIRRHNIIAPRAILLAASTPYYYSVKLSDGLVSSIQIQWHDATSSFTVTAYTSNVESPTVPATGAAGPSLEEWHNESTALPITGASASAAGCDLAHIGNNGARWLLLKFDVAADSQISITVHGKA
jgi:hypothetical protein